MDYLKLRECAKERREEIKRIKSIKFYEIPAKLPRHQKFISRINTPQSRLLIYEHQLIKELDISLFLKIGHKTVSDQLVNIYNYMGESEHFCSLFEETSLRMERYSRNQWNWVEETLTKPFAVNSVDELSLKIGFWSDFISQVMKFILRDESELDLGDVVQFTDSLYDANHSMLYTHDFERNLSQWEIDSENCGEKRRLLSWYLKHRTVAVDRLYDYEKPMMKKIDKLHSHYGLVHSPGGLKDGLL